MTEQAKTAPQLGPAAEAPDGLTPERLVDLERIKTLKYRYFRGIDTKDLDLVVTCFTPDATATYGGKYSFSGGDAIRAFLDKTIGRPGLLTQHHLHHPEITFLSDDEARGTWALEDIVIDTDMGATLRGAALYDDYYVRGEDGRWRMATTLYKRLYEELRPRRDDEIVTASWFGTGGDSTIPYDQV